MLSLSFLHWIIPQYIVLAPTSSVVDSGYKYVIRVGVYLYSRANCFRLIRPHHYLVCTTRTTVCMNNYFSLRIPHVWIWTNAETQKLLSLVCRQRFVVAHIASLLQPSVSFLQTTIARRGFVDFEDSISSASHHIYCCSPWHANFIHRYDWSRKGSHFHHLLVTRSYGTYISSAQRFFVSVVDSTNYCTSTW